MKHFRIPVARKLIPALRPARYKGLRGGRGGTKSYFAADYVVAKALEGHKCLCVREIQISLDQSSKALIEERIFEHGLEDRFRILRSHIETIGNKGRIEFKGMQQFNAANIKSLQGYSIAWWEEAHVASQYALDLLIPTIRMEGSELLFTWNPEFPEDPIERLFCGPNSLSGEDVILITVNSEDNPWLPEVLRKEREDAYRRDPEKADWVWGGNYRTISDANVLKGIYRKEAFEVLDHWDGPYQGMDFGFANDPTAAVRFYIFDKSLYMRHAAGTVGLDLDVTEKYMVERIPNWDKYHTRCDNARPESISYLNKHNNGKYSAADKWPGSVEDGVAWLRQFDEIVIHPDADEFYNECRRYSYQVNKAGDVLPKIEDAFNHYIDATRYAAAPLIRNKGVPQIRGL
jgi:phage terminase large subunit